MKERRIPFSGPMILALLDNKIETRRVIKPQPWQNKFGTWIWEPKGWQHCWAAASAEQLARMIMSPKPSICPYGQAGDIILATETWRLHEITKGAPAFSVKVEYRATGSISDWIRVEYTMVMHQAIRYWQAHPTHWRPARYMPKEFSRIKREIVEVRAERLQDIDWSGLIAEGWSGRRTLAWMENGARAWFIALWDSINAKRGYPYSSNPWDWVLTFKKVEA